MIVIVMLGAPGVGKGTQAKMLSKKYNLKILAAGDILRRISKDGSDSYISKTIGTGALVDDDIIAKLMKDELNKSLKSNGVILDGFPRTLKQAKLLKNMLSDINISDNDVYIVSLTLDEKEIIKRLSSRFFCKNCDAAYNYITKPTRRNMVCDLCSGNSFYKREDDKIDAIKFRLKTYILSTKPLIDYYSKYPLYIVMNAIGDPTVINDKICSLIKSS